jgi:hypothetical protein
MDCRDLPTDILILVAGMIFELQEFASRTLDKAASESRGCVTDIAVDHVNQI